MGDMTKKGTTKLMIDSELDDSIPLKGFLMEKKLIWESLVV